MTAQDTIAAAIENNLDLQVDRYGPLAAKWGLQRAQGGGPLRGVTSGNSLVSRAQSGQGVVGTEVSAGLVQNGNGSTSNNGNALVSQIGPVTQNLDPVLQNATAWSHTTTPQPNSVISETTALIDTKYVYNTFVQQGLLSGGYVQVTANASYLKENTPTDVLNPSTATVAQMYFRHNFLNSFGTTVNSRFIHVAEKNVLAANETFQSQLLNLVTSVLNAYWDLVAADEDFKIKQRALEAAEESDAYIKKQIGLGVLARVEQLRADAEVSSRKQALAIATASVSQQENSLKEILTLNTTDDPLIDAAEIVPLDYLRVPEEEDLPPLRVLVRRALAKRPDVALTNLNQEVAEISSLGTANGLLPVLQGIVAITANGLAGTPTPQPPGSGANPYFAGGVGTALGQVARRDFPSDRAAVLFEGKLRNQVAQGDYGVEQLQLQQNKLAARKSLNQVVVDISNQVVAVRQARARYSAALESRTLAEQLLAEEKQKFSLGNSTVASVISVQQDLVTAQSTEVSGLSGYVHARIALDQVLGETLENNHVSTSDALVGRAMQ
ncbi:MAG: TolC family protein [Bryobacteraceae bacterium]